MSPLGIVLIVILIIILFGGLERDLVRLKHILRF